MQKLKKTGRSKFKFRYLFGFLLFVWPVTLPAQNFPVDAATGKIYYAEEVLVKDGPQWELYHRAKAWFATFGKTKHVITVDDLPNGVLIGQNYSPLLVTSPGKNQRCNLWYTLKIEIADDRYWYSLTNFELEPVITLKANAAKPVITRQPLELAVLPQKGKSSPDKPLSEAVHESLFSLIQSIKKSMD